MNFVGPSALFEMIPPPVALLAMSPLLPKLEPVIAIGLPSIDPADPLGTILLTRSLTTLNGGTVQRFTEFATGRTTFVYTPAPAFTGVDTFQYVVQDKGGLVSAPATVTVKLTKTPPVVGFGVPWLSVVVVATKPATVLPVTLYFSGYASSGNQFAPASDVDAQPSMMLKSDVHSQLYDPLGALRTIQ